jgi:hypothetical protein
MCTITLFGGILLTLAHTTCTTTADLDKPKPVKTITFDKDGTPKELPPNTSWPFGMALKPDGAPLMAPGVQDPPPPTPPKGHKVTLRHEPGGDLTAHWQRFVKYGEGGNEVQVLGACNSACTMLLLVVDEKKICFGPKASLGYHWFETKNRGEPDSAYRPDRQKTERLIDRSPAPIKAWLEAKGGVDAMPHREFWRLNANELWKMGYRKCAD